MPLVKGLWIPSYWTKPIRDFNFQSKNLSKPILATKDNSTTPRCSARMIKDESSPGNPKALWSLPCDICLLLRCSPMECFPWQGVWLQPSVHLQNSWGEWAIGLFYNEMAQTVTFLPILDFKDYSFSLLGFELADCLLWNIAWASERILGKISSFLKTADKTFHSKAYSLKREICRFR